MSPVTPSGQIAAAGHAATRLAAPLIIGLLIVVAILQGQRTDQAVNDLRDLAAAQRTALVAGCERGNDLRAQVTANVSVLDEFLEAAAAARRASGDKQVADGYEQLRTKLAPLDPVDCATAYPDTPR